MLLFNEIKRKASKGEIKLKKIVRCSWCGEDEEYIAYHDNEWGKPLHDDKKLYEMLILEGAQAGLSWITILKRRNGYRAVFDNFNIEENANYSDDELEKKLLDKRIIRNRLKVYSVRKNAIAFKKIVDEFGSFDKYIWSFVNGEPIINYYIKESDIPSSTTLSKKISKELKKRGFAFVGPTICYAYMQAIGMVNDHVMGCIARDKILTNNNYTLSIIEDKTK